MKTLPTSKKEIRGLKEGYRSGLEDKIGEQLKSFGIPVLYETTRIHFTQPEKKRTYKPDFLLPNGIIIESKGRFTAADRMKHVWVKEQHPTLDIRFVFSNSKNKIAKGSPTSYAAWCEKEGFKYADKLIPVEWLKEKKHG